MRDFSALYVRFGSQADIAVHSGHVRFTPESGPRSSVPLNLFHCPGDQ